MLLRDLQDVRVVINTSEQNISYIYAASLTSEDVHLGFSAALRRLLIETIFFGLYSLLVVPCFNISFRSGSQSKSKMMVMAACLIMYAAAAIHYFLAFAWLIQDDKMLGYNIHDVYSCFANLAREAVPNDPYDKGTACTNIADASATNDTALSILLLVNIVLSDAIVAWRVCVVWPGNRLVRFCGLLLVLGTLATSSYSAIQNSHQVGSPARWEAETHANATNGNGEGFEFVDVCGSIALVLSWVTNIFATAALSCKAWLHRRDIHGMLGRGNSRTYAEQILLLFIESGVLYSLLWTLLVAGAFINLSQTTTAPTSATPYLAAILTQKSSAIIHIIGMYPTLVIILVSFTNTYTEPDLSRHVAIDLQPSLPKYRPHSSNNARPTESTISGFSFSSSCGTPRIDSCSKHMSESSLSCSSEDKTNDPGDLENHRQIQGDYDGPSAKCPPVVVGEKEKSG